MEEEEEEKEDENTTTMQSSTAVQQSCTFAQGNCFFPVNKDEKGVGGGNYNYNAPFHSHAAEFCLWAKATVSLQ